ncbi:hypothetical protein [Planococcus chinensis]|uniref:Uncharacterized protein n=1 Tax=Planococcus chinensis TaxID=272917 RepID=A0ABW4QMA3_9BACL
MKLSGQEVEEKLMATGYIDTELKDLTYDHGKHLVTMKYMGLNEGETQESEYTILFKDCFSVNFNTWLEGMEGDVPQSPSDLDFWFHDISIRGIEINGVHLYQCKMVIPMMHCQLTCKSIAITKS